MNNSSPDEDENSLVSDIDSELESNMANEQNGTFIRSIIKKKGSLPIIIISFLLALGLGAIVAVVPAIITDRYARINHEYTGEFCAHISSEKKPNECHLGGDDAQSAAANSALIQKLITFFASPVVGSASDINGRKVMLLAGIFLTSLPPLTLIMVQSYSFVNPILYYFGLSMTGFVQCMPIMFSSLADIMPPKWRAPAFGLSMAAFFLALSISPTIAAFSNHRMIPFFSYGILLLCFFFALFALPETLPPENRSQEKKEDDTEMSFVKKVVLRPFRDLSILNRSKFSRIIGIIVFLDAMVQSSDTIFLYYVENHLDFTVGDVARFFLIYGLFGLFAQVYVLKSLTKRVGERRVLIISFMIGTMYTFFYGIANAKIIIYMGAVMSALCSMGYPTVSSMNSYNGAAHEQGLLQGALASLSALAQALGPMVLKYVYDRTKDGSSFGPGTMFFVGTILYFVNVIFAYILPAEQANSKRKKGGLELNRMLLLDNDHLGEIQDDMDEESINQMLLLDDSHMDEHPEHLLNQEITF